MFSASLFLGFQLSSNLEKALEGVNPALLSMFVNNDSDYLHKCSFREQQYIGKEIETPLSISRMEALEAHVYSLMKRVLPSFSTQEYSLLLIAIPSYE